MVINNIQSDSLLDSVEQNSRVRAGPGAGKTHWLIHHIHHILQTGKQLHTVGSKVLCISYTNVAVNQIRTRLGSDDPRVEITTIHAWLYRMIVKPYLHLLTDDDGDPLINYQAVDGHDRHRPNHAKVDIWLKTHAPKQKYLIYSQWKELADYLVNLHWKRIQGTWILTHSSYTAINIKQTALAVYKQLYWKDGILDHSDILYCAARLLEENPSLARFLAARYPYIVIDEFQDTNPLQTKIIERLAHTGAWVTVIGDPAQSIYEFQDAQPEDFDTVSLPECHDYVIASNRRSTISIVNFLNQIRPDLLKQQYYRDVQGPKVEILTGDSYKIVDDLRLQVGDSLVVLARRNSTVDFLMASPANRANDQWGNFRTIDQDRSRFVEQCMQSQELFEQGLVGEAINILSRTIRRSSGRARTPVKLKQTPVISKDRSRTLSVMLLLALQNYVTTHPDASIMDVYQAINTAWQGHELALQGYNQGNSKDFVESTSWISLRQRLPFSERLDTVRTIHKAKGDEFDYVLVCVDKEKDLEKALQSTTPQNEDQRVFYVACSRAREKLWINVPAITPKLLGLLLQYGIHYTSTDQPLQQHLTDL